MRKLLDWVRRLVEGRVLDSLEPLVAKASSLGMPHQDVENALEYISVFEYELALDTLLERAYEFDLKIDHGFYELAKRSCEALDVDFSKYSYLNELLKESSE